MKDHDLTPSQAVAILAASAILFFAAVFLASLGWHLAAWMMS